MCNNDLLFQIEWEKNEGIDSRGFHFYAIIAAPEINGELISERGKILYIGGAFPSGQIEYPEKDAKNRIDAYMREHKNDQKIIQLGRLVYDKSLQITTELLNDIKECLISDNDIIEDIQKKPTYSGRPLKIENKNDYLPLKQKNIGNPLDIT